MDGTKHRTQKMTNTNKTKADFAIGDPVTYIPNHADGDASHPDCETGHVSSIREDSEYVWVRFKSACGACCDPSNLI